MDLHGVLPPITTPFKDDGFDPVALRHNIERWSTTGLTGIVALGSNGEATLLDDDEADRVIGTAREHTPTELVLIAGTARESTKATIAATKRAAGMGVDAVLVRTPSYFKRQMTSDVLVRHYRAVADASPVPVLLYNFTGVTGINLQPEAAARMAEHPNIAGIKESGGDVAQVAALVDLTPDDFTVVVGAAPSFYASLCLGAVGGILALACVVPAACVQLYKLTVEGRHAEARRLQRQLSPLAAMVTSKFGVPGLKAAMDLAGFVGGPPRSPLPPASEAAIHELRSELETLSQLDPA
jgi:4-hydroxy-2-oxoglutarate aldolase